MSGPLRIIIDLIFVLSQILGEENKVGMKNVFEEIMSQI